MGIPTFAKSCQREMGLRKYILKSGFCFGCYIRDSPTSVYAGNDLWEGAVMMQITPRKGEWTDKENVVCWPSSSKDHLKWDHYDVPGKTRANVESVCVFHMWNVSPWAYTSICAELRGGMWLQTCTFEFYPNSLLCKLSPREEGLNLPGWGSKELVSTLSSVSN